MTVMLMRWQGVGEVSVEERTQPVCIVVRKTGVFVVATV